MLDFLYDNKILRIVLCSIFAFFSAAALLSGAVRLGGESLDGTFGMEVFGDHLNIYPITNQVESDKDEGSREEDNTADTPPSSEGDLKYVEIDLSASSHDEIIDYTGRADVPVGIFSSGGVLPSGSPSVLIIHTHGSESYAAAGEIGYSHDEDFHSRNPDEGVVAIGSELAEALRGVGLGVIHCETMFDYPSFEDAYKLSSAAVRAYLQEYPTIEYVIDLHRDSIESNGSQAAVRTHIGDKSAAQLMFVVGTDTAGGNHPDWKANFALAAGLQKRIAEEYPTLVRPINLRRETFNQQLSDGYILIEIGACGNTLEEAKYTARIFASAFTSYLGFS